MESKEKEELYMRNLFEVRVVYQATQPSAPAEPMFKLAETFTKAFRYMRSH